MKKDNSNTKKTNEDEARNVSEKQPEKKDVRAELQAKAAAEAKKKKRQKRILIGGCCAVAVAAVIGIAVAGAAGIRTAKPSAIPVKVADASSVSTGEDDPKTETGVIKKETESPKEQTDGRKTSDDKETKREADKVTKTPDASESSVSDKPETKEQGVSDTVTEEPSRPDSEPQNNQDRTQDTEPAQETLVIQPAVKDAPETPAPTQAPQEDVYLPAEPIVTTAPHTHTWQARVKVIHHEAVTEEVKVVDRAAYTEPVFEEQPVYETVAVYVCDVCGAEFDSITEHSETHIDWETFTNPFHYHVDFRQGEQIGTEMVQTGSITHPEVSHMETRVVKAAYDEEVPDGYVCTGCGAVQ